MWCGTKPSVQGRLLGGGGTCPEPDGEGVRKAYEKMWRSIVHEEQNGLEMRYRGFQTSIIRYLHTRQSKWGLNLKKVGDYCIIIGREVTRSNLCIRKNTVNEDRVISWLFVEVHGNSEI